MFGRLAGRRPSLLPLGPSIERHKAGAVRWITPPLLLSSPAFASARWLVPTEAFRLGSRAPRAGGERHAQAARALRSRVPVYEPSQLGHGTPRSLSRALSAYASAAAWKCPREMTPEVPRFDRCTNGRREFQACKIFDRILVKQASTRPARLTFAPWRV